MYMEGSSTAFFLCLQDTENYFCLESYPQQSPSGPSKHTL